MTLLDDARRLANTDPEVADFCFACGNDSHKHYEDCQWFAMPKILAVVEAASRLIEMHHVGDPVGTHHVATESPYWQALVTALRGEDEAT